MRLAQSVEHHHAIVTATGSNPVSHNDRDQKILNNLTTFFGKRSRWLDPSGTLHSMTFEGWQSKMKPL